MDCTIWCDIKLIDIYCPRYSAQTQASMSICRPIEFYQLKCRGAMISASTSSIKSNHLIHLIDQRIDLLFPIAQITSLHKVLEFPSPETAGWVGEFEWPKLLVNISYIVECHDDLEPTRGSCYRAKECQHSSRKRYIQ